MNQRIKELIKQATSIEYGVDNGFDMVIFDKEKFAQLIVEECAKVCLNPNHWHEDAAGETYNRVIKEHFGVKA